MVEFDLRRSSFLWVLGGAMSQAPLSRTGADILTRSKRKTGTKNQSRRPSSATSSAHSSYPLQYFGAYGRLVAKLRRCASVLEADDGLLLPRVSVNDLERAASTFLDEIRLGLPREDTIMPTGSSTTRGRYGRKLQTEIVDPELSMRVRKNRAAFKEQQAEALSQRGGRANNASLGKV